MNNKQRDHITDMFTQKPLSFSVLTRKEIVKEVEYTEQREELRKIKYWFFPFLHKHQKIKVEVANTRLEKEEVEEYKDFFLYPITLGKRELLAKLLRKMDIDYEMIEKEPQREIDRLCAEHTDSIAEIVAIVTEKDYKKALDDKHIKGQSNFFKENLQLQDIGTVFTAIYSQADYANFLTSMRLLKIWNLDKETEKRAHRIEQ